MNIGLARFDVPISHYSYVMPQPNHGAYGHHETRQVKPGAWWCGLCGRWVVRGMGRWWERQS